MNKKQKRSEKKNQESVKSIGNTIKSNTPTRRVSKERERQKCYVKK
jgi:hypothetical protein